MSFLNSLDKLRSAGGDKWTSLCPVHNNKTSRTLSIKQNPDGSFMCHCFSCGANGVEVFNALGLPLDELFGFKDKPKQVITQKQREDYDLDKWVVAIFEAEREAGRRHTHQDFRRNKLAVARIAGIDQLITIVSF